MITGKKLISSESATWLNEHFTSTLADIKIAVEVMKMGAFDYITKPLFPDEILVTIRKALEAPRDEREPMRQERPAAASSAGTVSRPKTEAPSSQGR